MPGQSNHYQVVPDTSNYEAPSGLWILSGASLVHDNNLGRRVLQTDASTNNSDIRTLEPIHKIRSAVLDSNSYSVEIWASPQTPSTGAACNSTLFSYGRSSEPGRCSSAVWTNSNFDITTNTTDGSIGWSNLHNGRTLRTCISSNAPSNTEPSQRALAGYHHYVFVYNATSMSMFIDGVLVETSNRMSGSASSIEDSMTNVSPWINNAYLTVTGRIGDSCSKWNGKIDSIAMWKRSLSPQEIGVLYQLPSNATKSSCYIPEEFAKPTLQYVLVHSPGCQHDSVPSTNASMRTVPDPVSGQCPERTCSVVWSVTGLVQYPGAVVAVPSSYISMPGANASNIAVNRMLVLPGEHEGALVLNNWNCTQFLCIQESATWKQSVVPVWVITDENKSQRTVATNGSEPVYSCTLYPRYHTHNTENETVSQWRIYATSYGRPTNGNGSIVYPLLIEDRNRNPLVFYDERREDIALESIRHVMRNALRNRMSVVLIETRNPHHSNNRSVVTHVPDETYLAVVYDVPNDENGGQISVKITIENATNTDLYPAGYFPVVGFTESFDGMDSYVWDNATGVLNISSAWGACCDEGFVIGPVRSCVTIEFLPQEIYGVSDNDVAWITSNDAYISESQLMDISIVSASAKPRKSTTLRICPVENPDLTQQATNATVHCTDGTCSSTCITYDRCGVCNGDGSSCPWNEEQQRPINVDIAPQSTCSIDSETGTNSTKYILRAQGIVIANRTTLEVIIACKDQELSHQLSQNWEIREEPWVRPAHYVQFFEQVVDASVLDQCILGTENALNRSSVMGSMNITSYWLAQNGDEASDFEELDGSVYFYAPCRFGVNRNAQGVTSVHYGIGDIGFQMRNTQNRWIGDDTLDGNSDLSERCLIRDPDHSLSNAREIAVKDMREEPKDLIMTLETCVERPPGTDVQLVDPRITYNRTRFNVVLYKSNNNTVPVTPRNAFSVELIGSTGCNANSPHAQYSCCQTWTFSTKTPSLASVCAAKDRGHNFKINYNEAYFDCLQGKISIDFTLQITEYENSVPVVHRLPRRGDLYMSVCKPPVFVMQANRYVSEQYSARMRTYLDSSLTTESRHFYDGERVHIGIDLMEVQENLLLCSLAQLEIINATFCEPLFPGTTPPDCSDRTLSRVELILDLSDPRHPFFGSDTWRTRIAPHPSDPSCKAKITISHIARILVSRETSAHSKIEITWRYGQFVGTISSHPGQRPRHRPHGRALLPENQMPDLWLSEAVVHKKKSYNKELMHSTNRRLLTTSVIKSLSADSHEYARTHPVVKMFHDAEEDEYRHRRSRGCRSRDGCVSRQVFIRCPPGFSFGIDPYSEFGRCRRIPLLAPFDRYGSLSWQERLRALVIVFSILFIAVLVLMVCSCSYCASTPEPKPQTRIQNIRTEATTSSVSRGVKQRKNTSTAKVPLPYRASYVDDE